MYPETARRILETLPVTRFWEKLRRPLLNESQIKSLGKELPRQTGMYEYQKAWKEVLLSLLRVVTTSRLYSDTTFIAMTPLHNR